MRLLSQPVERWIQLLAASASVCAALDAQADFEKARAKHEEMIRRIPFDCHTTGREALAATAHVKALEILSRDYAKPRSHPSYARYTLAALLGNHFQAAEFFPKLQGMRRKHARPEDAWLWVRTLVAKARSAPQEVVDLARGAKLPILRCASLLALARARSAGALAVIPELCEQLPKKPGIRRAALATMSKALLAVQSERGGAPFEEAAHAYIELLAKENKLSRTDQLIVIRHLGKLLGTNALWQNPEPWLELLRRPRAKTARGGTGTTTARPRFFGIESDGERICYVIDMSDSMCKKIDARIKPKAAITGRKKRKGKRTGIPDENDIPWFRVTTRFDLAREHLKISLQRLSKNKRFSVVWFGTESGTLDSCRGMVRATRSNVARVIKELDAIKPDSPTRTAPDGRLRGRTNIHSALRLAFCLKTKGSVAKGEYVHPAALAQGCDTVFLLSDGAPTWDDFDAVAPNYDNIRGVEDTEYPTARERTDHLHYFGPYARLDWIIEDVDRMNAFRGAQVYCVGLGEASMGLLDALARRNMGLALRFDEVK